jgi:hypothetical protein
MIENVQFEDFNFKLAVVQVLMYEQGVLLPEFDVYAFARNYEGREIDIDEEGDEIIPEVRRYFEALEVPASALAGIEALYQDGGNEIYMQLSPFWDGEDDRFNLRSAEDAALLPNLKRVTLFYDDDPQILQAFRDRGIVAGWL